MKGAWKVIKVPPQMLEFRKVTTGKKTSEEPVEQLKGRNPKLVFSAIFDAAENENIEAFQNYLDPEFIALVEKRDGSLKKLMADLTRARALGVMLYDPRGKSEKMEIKASGVDYELFLQRQGERWLLGSSSEEKKTATEEPVEPRGEVSNSDETLEGALTPPHSGEGVHSEEQSIPH